MAVGTASPKDWRIFVSSFLRNARFSFSGSWLRVSGSRSTQRKDSGTVIIRMISRMLKTRSSLGWMVFWLASRSFRVWMQGPTLSQYWRLYLSWFFCLLMTISPLMIWCGFLLSSGFSNADCPSFKSAIQARMCSG